MDHRGTTLEEALRKSLGQEHAGRHRRHAMEQGRSVDLEVFPPRPTSHKQISTHVWRVIIEGVIAAFPWPSSKDRILGARYLRGLGGTVTLRSLGLLEQIQREAERQALGRFRNQIWHKARQIGDGRFEDDFRRTYDFGSVLYSIREATLSGRFRGVAEQRPFGRQRVSGRATIEFFDTYRDPLSLEQAAQELMNDRNISFSTFSGEPFDIVDQWTIDIDIDR
ncbi:MAG: hypothetical protein AAF732_13470 [Pseudomonadota bacterium]